MDIILLVKGMVSMSTYDLGEEGTEYTATDLQEFSFLANENENLVLSN